MTTEQRDHTPPSEGRLAPGYKLLLANPGFLFAFPMVKGIGREKELGEELGIEYVSIYDVLVSLVGIENIRSGNIGLITGKVGKFSGKTKFKNQLFPINAEVAKLPFLNEDHLGWPRDAYTVLDGTILVNREAWKENELEIMPSGLGEGGEVLVRNNAILVTSTVWQANRKGEIAALKAKGYKVAPLPLVNARKQDCEFEESHVDGHASLIEDKDGNLALVVADSYSRQGSGTKKSIEYAASEIGARVIEVDDSNLPPLAFNLIQLEDGSIVVTGSEAKDLEFELSLLVGRDKVYTTAVPIERIPEMGFGSIRCLTNLIPPGSL